MGRRTKGTLFKRKRSKFWWLKYWVNGRRVQVSLETTDRDEAEKKALKEIQPVLTGSEAEKRRAMVHKLRDAEEAHQQAVEAGRERLTVDDAWKAFCDDRRRPQCCALTLKDYGQRWARFTRWWKIHAADRPCMEDVRPADADVFTQSLEDEGLSPNRYNKIVQTCRLVFNALAPLCADIPNPFGATSKRGIRNRPLRTESRRELSEGELKTVIEAATGEMRRLFALGVYTGLRLGDAATLRWDNVSLARVSGLADD